MSTRTERVRILRNMLRQYKRTLDKETRPDARIDLLMALAGFEKALLQEKQGIHSTLDGTPVNDLRPGKGQMMNEVIK